MKQFTLVFVFLVAPILLYGQIITDVYELEGKGYLRSPRQADQGIVATNNFASEIYLIADQEKSTLVSSPGAGMYYTVTPDRSGVGFKSIGQDGLQAPAVLDLATGEVRHLHEPVWSSGQPSFFKNGGYAYTIGNILMVHRGGSEQADEFDLGYYANMAPVSPDGNYVVFNNEHDELYLKNLTSGQARKISEEGYAAHGPAWSDDSRKIAYMTNGGELLVYSLEEDRNYTLGQGSDPSWLEESRELVFTRSVLEGFELKSMHIVRSRYDGYNQVNLTDPATTAARDASAAPGGDIIYYDALENKIMRLEKKNNQRGPIFEVDFGDGGGPFFSPAIWTGYNSVSGSDSRSAPGTGAALKRDSVNQVVPDNRSGMPRTGSAVQAGKLPDIYSLSDYDKEVSVQNLNASVLITDVPFINQVWDTPFFSGNNYNYAACAPATAAMAIGYFQKVPPWPSSRHHGITRNYANYVAREYAAYGHTYNTVSRGVMGGMGFMWSSRHGHTGSPRSTMARYINQHDLESVQVWSLPYSEMVSELENGNPYPLCVMLTSAGHLILAVGVQEGRRTVIVHDPYGNKNISYPSYHGENVVYDWPGYNYGNQNLQSVPWAVSARGVMPAVDFYIPPSDHQTGFASLAEGLEWVNSAESFENSIRFIIADDLDERGEELVLSGNISRKTPFSLVAADGIDPVIMTDQPLTIASSFVRIDGAGENGLPSMTFHYSGSEDGPIRITSASEEIAISNLLITGDRDSAPIPYAVLAGMDEDPEAGHGPRNATISNNYIGGESPPFINGIVMAGNVAEELTISENAVYVQENAIFFEKQGYDIKIGRAHV